MYIECGVGLRKSDMELKRHCLMAAEPKLLFLSTVCRVGLDRKRRFALELTDTASSYCNANVNDNVNDGCMQYNVLYLNVYHFLHRYCQCLSSFIVYSFVQYFISVNIILYCHMIKI